MTNVAVLAQQLTVDTITVLRSYAGLAPPTCWVAGYYAEGDGGEGQFWYNASDTTSTDNGGTIIVDGSSRRWYRQVGGGPWSIKWFGAKCDGSTDDTTAWNNILAAARLAGNPQIFHPGGNSIYTGNLPLINDNLMGVGSYYAPTTGGLAQDATITFHGNNAGITCANSASGGFTIEKIGFIGIPGSYSGQVGLLMSDSLRASQSEGWPTLRDVMFNSFSSGMLVGNKYQGGLVFNVFCYNSTVTGYQNQSTDWYHHGMYGGNPSAAATTCQLLLGDISGSPETYATGNHQFHGGAWFNGEQACVIQNTTSCFFSGVWFQEAVQNGILIGNGTNGAGLHVFQGCFFNTNNQSGGNRNTNGYSYYDICFTGGARDCRIIGCQFDSEGASTTAPCVAASIYIPENCTGTIIDGCSFNMDMVVPAAGGTPTTPILFDSFTLVNALDETLIGPTNFMVFGADGVYTFNYLPVTMALVAEPYTVNAYPSIQAGTCVMNAASGNISLALANPGFAGRSMMFTEETSGGGDAVVASTSGAFGGGHKTATFTAAGAYAFMVSTSATTWQVLNSSNVTFS